MIDTEHKTHQYGILNFFFRPIDPTILGFIRIVTGCLILYTHLAYTYDLENFFGPNAWYSTEAANRERREVPSYAAPLTWDDIYEPTRMAQLPEPPHRRAAVANYLRNLIDEKNSILDVDKKLALMIRLNNIDLEQVRNREGDADNAAQGLVYLSLLSNEPIDRKSQLAVLIDEDRLLDMQQSRIPELPIPTVPNAIRILNQKERERVAEEIEQMYSSLPSDPEQRTIVITYWREMDFGQRTATIHFIRNLMKFDAPTRLKKLEYLVHWNVDPAVPHRMGAPTFSIWYHLTEPWELYAAHYSMLIVMFLFTIGYYTRVTSFLTWLALLMYIHRSAQTLFGMDTMMNITMIYLMIGNSGAALSIDRMRYRYHAIKHALDTNRKLDDPLLLQYLHAPPKSISTGFAIRLLQIHFCFIYMAAGLSKLKGPSWWSTNAYWDTLVNPEFTLIYYRWYEDTLRALISTRIIYAIMAAIAIAYTFIAEIGLPFLVWTRLRPYVVMIGIGLHFGVGLFMGLIVFSLFMMTMLLAYLPSSVIRNHFFDHDMSKNPKLLKYNPMSQGIKNKIAMLLVANHSNNIRVEEDKTVKDFLLIDGSSQHEGQAALKAVLTDIPFWHPYRFFVKI